MRNGLAIVPRNTLNRNVCPYLALTPLPSRFQHAGEFRGAPPFTPPRNRMKFSMRSFIACVAFNESGLPSGESSPNKHGSAGEYALRSALFRSLSIQTSGPPQDVNNARAMIKT